MNLKKTLNELLSNTKNDTTAKTTYFPTDSNILRYHQSVSPEVRACRGHCPPLSVAADVDTDFIDGLVVDLPHMS